MNKFISIISVISTLLLKSTLTAAQEGSILHIHINDGNNVSSLLNGYKMDIKEDKVTTIENNTVPTKAMVDAINNGSFNDNKSSSLSFVLIPVFALFCIYVIASVGLLIKKKNSIKSKPKRRSLHFEDDDELSKILVQSPAATAIGNDTLTVRSITKETNISKNFGSKSNSKKNVAFLPINHAYKATLPWNPKHLDELKLKVGDIVCIKKCYSDGYSYGRNVTTRVDGIFPTCCLSTMDESIDQAAIEEWVNSGMVNTKKRTTSLFLNDISYKI